MSQAKVVFSCAFAGLLGGIGIGCWAYGLFFIISAYMNQHEIMPIGYLFILFGFICLMFAYISGNKTAKNQCPAQAQPLE